ncbi:lipocalin family protein [Flavobacterium limnophilum]|uniref:lipocalin family protein n=1 Tax=Flavobacterium limnophilum TaxID=3003262 RepID=UPI0022AC6B9E|nr:lipocalin family protein [Flavobacterium limnophilum]
MKKISVLIISALTLVFAFSSCCDDEDSPIPVSIKGKWNFDKMSLTVNGVTSPELDYDDNEPGCSKDYIEFAPTAVFNEGDYSGSDCLLDITTGTWYKNGNVVTITSDGVIIPFEVVSLTSTTLKVKYSEIQDGTTAIVNMTFVKA